MCKEFANCYHCSDAISHYINQKKLEKEYKVLRITWHFLLWIASFCCFCGCRCSRCRFYSVFHRIHRVDLILFHWFTRVLFVISFLSFVPIAGWKSNILTDFRITLLNATLSGAQTICVRIITIIWLRASRRPARRAIATPTKQVNHRFRAA